MNPYRDVCLSECGVVTFRVPKVHYLISYAIVVQSSYYAIESLSFIAFHSMDINKRMQIMCMHEKVGKGTGGYVNHLPFYILCDCLGTCFDFVSHDGRRLRTSVSMPNMQDMIPAKGTLFRRELWSLLYRMQTGTRLAIFDRMDSTSFGIAFLFPAPPTGHRVPS